MLGLSVYIASTKEQQNKTISMLKDGDYCFVSLHHPLDMTKTFKNDALDLINRINVREAKIIADVSPVGIEKLGFTSFEDMAKANLVWGLRPDYGLSAEEIAHASNYTNIVINASNIDYELVELLYKNNVKFYAMHNFYPRPETGLDIDFCNECTNYLHEKGADVWAFASGDGDKRGSVYEGLPTIEAYRYYPSYVQYALLKNKCLIDTVFIGDISLYIKSLELIQASEQDNILRLPSNIDVKFRKDLLDKIFTIRPDNNSIVARLQESRIAGNTGRNIEVFNTIERNIGSITMDNYLYNVYSGEVQICLKDLPLDEKVNVIGNIDKNYLELLDLCCRKQEVMFVKYTH